jgi:hypothetical protein
LVVEYVPALFHTMIPLARKAKTAGKSAVKTFKKTVGIPTGQLSEANPRYYMVIAAQGALVRKEVELTSPEVYSLSFGDVVTCAEIIGRRARIIDPVEGWVSLVSSENDALFELTFPPDKRTQVRTMERRFEKLKQQQAAVKSGEGSPVATPQVIRTSDKTEPEDNGVSALKTKIVFKSTPTGDDVPVPRLDTSLKKPPKLSTGSRTPPPQDLLFDFEASSEFQTVESTAEPVAGARDSDFSLI